MAAQVTPSLTRIPAAIAMGAGAWFVLDHYGLPLEVMLTEPIPASAALLLGMSALAGATDSLRLVARFIDWRNARKTTGLKGTAGWVRSLHEIRHDLVTKGWGPYWGTLNGKEIIADFSSNAMTVAPAGSGKFIFVVANQVLSIRESKFVIDLKGEIACVLAKALRDRGEDVLVINLPDLWLDQLGAYDAEYNVLGLIVDNFTARRNGLLDVSDDVHELTMQLYPEPASSGSGGSDNGFFRGGSRRLIAFCIITTILVDGENASLSGVYLRLQDRKLTQQEALWASGRLEVIDPVGEDGDATLAEMPIKDSPWVGIHDADVLENFITYYRSLADGVADLYSAEDDRTLMSFLEGARQALARFNPSTRGHLKTARSTFRFADMKKGKKPTTVFLVGDATRVEAQKDLIGLIQWGFINEIKRAPDKQRPVYLIADDVCNSKINDTGSILIFGRGYGLRFHLIFQSFAAFRRVYGQDVLATLLSEAEIKCFLPGQREPEVLSYLEKQLGQQSLMVRGNRGDRASGVFGMGDYDLREEGRAMLTSDEISRLDRTLLSIRRNKWILTDLPLSYAQIAPFKRLADINPFHGKRFIKRTKLRLSHRDGIWLLRLFRLLGKAIRKGRAI